MRLGSAYRTSRPANDRLPPNKPLKLTAAVFSRVSCFDDTRHGRITRGRSLAAIPLGRMQIEAGYICAGDAEKLQETLAGTPWGRGVQFFEQLVHQHEAAARRVWVGLADGQPVAFGSLVLESSYPPFREQDIPEIQDLNVSPRFRRLRIASSILDHAERAAFERSDSVGIGFGLHPGYRAAQRLYVLRGYVPDGNGVFWRGRFPQEGEQVQLDDDLILYLIKRRPTAARRSQFGSYEEYLSRTGAA